jgi:uncharacterized phage protein gp47/JayE
MPFPRPSLTEIRNQAAADVSSNLPGADGLLRFSNMQILATSLAGMIYEEYGYTDWIALNAVPFTATAEFLEGWAALRDVFRLPPSPAIGTVTFTGAPGASIPAATRLSRGDGYAYITNTDATVGGGGTITVAVTAVLPPIDPTNNPAGNGALGNMDAGTALTLANAVTGVQSSTIAASTFTGGVDVETDDSMRGRMLLAYQNPPHGGDRSDYIVWARNVPGVTRAWTVPNGMGAGTVVVYFMMDVAESAHQGFPQGANGVATDETRGGAIATGDQLAVANYIYGVQPVTATVYAYAPIAGGVDFTIHGIPGASAATKAAISAAIAGVFAQYGAPGGVVDLSYLESAIGAVPGTTGFIITTPAGNVASAVGAIPTVGAITYL